MAIDKVVDAYFAAIPEDRRPMVEMLHKLIVGLFPEVEVSMGYRMPTYRVGDGWVAIANQKNYVSLYTCGYHHIVDFKTKHPKIKTGKGCINFKNATEIPLKDLEDVVKHAINHPKG
ncbi:MAG: DUF1801 domain-containing protein [bacterium]|nr:DUF1801 domain-containing protein [bacterium]